MKMETTNNKTKLKNYIVTKSQSKDPITIIDDNDSGIFEGHRTKRRVLIKNDENVKFLIETLKSPTATYVTHEKAKIVKGIEPEYLSAIKIFHSLTEQPKTTNDTLACQLLNYFQIPTAMYFNVLQDNNEAEQQTSNSKFSTYTISLNFLGENETFETFLMLNEFPYDLDSFLTSVDRIVDQKHKPTTPFIHLADIRKINDKKQELREKFAYTYLVRKLFLGDSDFSAQNAGIIFNNKTKQLDLAPNFDLELCIDSSRIPWMTDINLPEDLRILKNQYPQVLDTFLTRARNLFTINPETNKMVIDEIKENTPFIRDDNFDKAKEILSGNLKLIEYQKDMTI